MKKIICAFLLVTLLCSLVGCSVSSTKQYDELVVEHNNLQARNDTLKAEYNNLVAKYDDLKAKYDNIEVEYAELTEKYEALDTLYNDYVALTESQMAKRDVTFEAVGKTISDKAVTSVMEDVVVIRLPYGIIVDDIDAVMNGCETIGLLLSTSEYKSCVLLFVDNKGVCHTGMNLSLTEGVSYFEKKNK